MKEFKIEVLKENAASVIFLGNGKLPIRRMEDLLNQYGDDGWDLSFQIVEWRRLLLFWRREAAIITFSREKKS
jgi:hypothetical protein